MMIAVFATTKKLKNFIVFTHSQTNKLERNNCFLKEHFETYFVDTLSVLMDHRGHLNCNVGQGSLFFKHRLY